MKFNTIKRGLWTIVVVLAVGGGTKAQSPVVGLTSSSPRVYKASCAGVFSGTITASMWGMGSGGTTCATAASNSLGLLMDSPGTLSNLSVRCGTAGLNASSGVWTLFVSHPGGTRVSTGISLTMGTTAANTVITSTSPPYTYAAGDLIGIQAATQTGETLSSCNATFNY